MLQVKGLSKKYKNILAVDSISFEVNSGEIGVLLGPNGAGKSTTIKSIAGLLKFNGEILIDDMQNKSVEAKKIFGYVPESAAVYEYLTVLEHIEFIAKAYRLDDSYKERAQKLLKRFDLDDKTDKLGRELSKGMQQKLSICCALIINPRMVMFDEPMMGLDPKAIKELKNIFIELKNNGCAVLISTHIIDSIKEVWDKVLIMNKGKVVLSRTRADLERKAESLENVFFKTTEGAAGP